MNIALAKMRTISVTEYQTEHLPADDLSNQEALILWQNYASQIDIKPPSFMNNQQWELVGQGWVGHIPVTKSVTLTLHPKVALDNLFQMFEYAYNLRSFRFLEGLIKCDSLQDFYEQLAHILAKRVLDRARQGFYRAYLSESGNLVYIRGQMDVRRSLQQPGQVRLPCRYETHTTDIKDNQILAGTLFQILRRGLHQPRIKQTAQSAYRSFQGGVTPTSHPASSCLNRTYHRLNDDYQPMHALCHFFLSQTGPSHRIGEQLMIPFLVNMARLYERFVAEWLKQHLPSGWRIKTQERVNLGDHKTLHFDIDLVLYDQDGSARFVLDTKYKTPRSPSTDDIQQMISYAHIKTCPEAILIYPTPLDQPFDEVVEGIRIRSVTFGLAGALNETGQQFVTDLGIHRDTNATAA